MVVSLIAELFIRLSRAFTETTASQRPLLAQSGRSTRFLEWPAGLAG
jgi:hypothetical protein